MPISRFERYLPYAGVVAGILFAIGGFVPKMSDQAGDANAIQLLNDNAARNLVGAVAFALFGVVMAFFATAIRQALRSGEPGESSYSSVAYAGGTLVGFAMILQAWLIFAGTDAADKGDRTAVTVLGYLGIDGWLPWVASSAVLFLAAGFGALRTAALPKWLALATVVLGVLCLLGPTGIVVYFATPVWLVVTGVVLARHTAPHEVVITPHPAQG
jgi:uncharacterized membrane protein